MRFVYFLIPLALISACGGGGGGGDPSTPPTPVPTVNLSAEPTSVLLENSSTLTWSSSNATSCSATWTTQTTTSGSQAVTISNPGNNSFSITCSGAGGSGSASVTVEGYRNTDGVVVDGYISGAQVCIDENASWTCDGSESTTTSDNAGTFTIKYANGNLLSIGGTDLDSQALLDNLLITHKLAGYSAFKAVTPVTSVAAFMDNPSQVNAALGIDASIDVFTFDPVANKGDGGIYDYLYEKGNQLTVLAFALQNITNNLKTTTETTQDYFKAITEEIVKEYTETGTKVDIETEGFVTKAIENVIATKSVTITEEAKANTAKALASVLPVIEVKSSNTLTTGVIRFAISTLQTDIQAIANGTASPETITSYTQDILNLIATDQNIDANEITPDITAIADSATTAEDTAVEINVLLNDSYLTSAPISVSAENGTNGTTSVNSNIITYDPKADFNGSDSFAYTINQGDKTSSADVTVTIEAVNDAPSINTTSTLQVAENQTAVTTISVSDVDEDTLTLTLSGADAESFNLSSENVLTFKEAPDYETKSSYVITLTLTDGTAEVSKDITINITNLNDNSPIISSSAAFNAAENQTAIGTVTATDADGDAVIFTISGDELEITSAGVLSFSTAPDYEIKTSYTATITASDGTNSTTQDITVSITNVNDVAPEFTSEAIFSAVENQTAIGTVTATDAEGDTVTFTISGTELAITSEGVLTFVEAPDYEIKNSYSATVTASDGVNTTNQIITINIKYEYQYPDHWDQHQNNLNKIKNIYTNPIGFNLDKIWFTTFNISKEKFSTTRFDYLLEDPYFSGKVGNDTWFTEGNVTYYFNCNWVANVPSEGATKIFKYVDGEFNQLIYQKNEGCNHPFSIKNKDGSYQHIFLGIDEGKIPSERIPVGDTYTFNTSTNEFVNLNLSVGSHGQHVFDYQQDGDEDIISNDFGNIVASSNPFILRNDGDNNFEVVMVPIPEYLETGELKYGAMSAAAYYESGYLKVVYTDFDISQALDNEWGIEPEKNVVVTYDPNNFNIIDITQLPTPYSEVNFVNLEYYDQSWVGGNGRSHDVRSTPIDLDYDGDIDIVIGSQVYGEVISLPQILINDNGVFKDETNTRLFNWVYATGSMHRWDFADVNGDGYLDIITKDGCNNLLQDSNGDLIDIRPNGCELKVAVNDGTGHFIAIIEPTHLLQIFEGNEFKTGRLFPIFGMDENRNLSWVYADGKGCNGCYNEGKQEIFTIKLDGIISTGPNGIDPAILGEPGYNEFYYLLHYPDAREAVISGQYENGLEHYIAVGKSLGYSPNAKASTSVVVDSYGANPVFSTKARYVNLIPSITSPATFSAAENQTAIGTVTATDADGDTITFTISGSELAITSAGFLAFVEAPDYETKSSYSATVTASDGTNSTTQDITINVTNVNDNSPSFTSSATFSAAENQTDIGTVTATDADGDAVTFTISGSELAITSAGVLTFASAPDYETKSSYSATVTASDGTNSTTQDITINVTDVNEAPSITSSATFSAAENQTAIGTVTATDADGDTVTFTVSGSELAITSTGVLTFVEAPDYETTTSFSATVTASDGTNSTNQDITVTVTNVNDNSPGFTSSATFSAAENQTAIGTVTATDADGDTVTFSVSGSELAITSTGVLTFVEAPDHETKSSYSATITASDGTNSTTQDISISVTDINENPSLVSEPSSLDIQENNTAIFDYDASDPEGDAIYYQITGTDRSLFSISADGVLSFKSAPDYENPLDSNADNLYDITVSVTDSNPNSALSQGINPSQLSLSTEQDAVSIRVTNFDEDLIYFDWSITSPDLGTAPQLTANFTTDKLTNANSVSMLIWKTTDGVQYWHDATLSSNEDFKVTWIIQKSLDLSIASGEYEVRRILITQEDGTQFNLDRDTIQSKGFTTQVNFYNPNSDSNSPELVSIDSIEVKNLGESLSVNPTVEVTFTATDIENAITNIGGYLEGPHNPSEFHPTNNNIRVGVWDWAESLGDNTYKYIFTLDPKTQSGEYLVCDYRISDRGGNSGGLTGQSNIESAGMTCSFTINNPLADNTNPVITSLELASNINSDGRKEILITGTILEEDTDINSAYVRFLDSQGNCCDYDRYLDVVYDQVTERYLIDTTLSLALEAPDGKYELQWIYVNDEALNMSSYFTSGLDRANIERFVHFGSDSSGGANSPVFTSSATFSAAENQTAIGTVTATDADGDAVTFTISGSELAITSAGVLTFASAPDYETKSSYSATVTASDGTNSTTQDITVNVTNVNDNSPSFTSSTTFSAAENQTAIDTVTATDADGDTITYSISGSDITINSSTGVIAFVSAPDYETKSSYSATVTASDGTNSTTQDITVNVTNVNDNSPSFTSSATFSAAENQTTIDTVTATDADGDAVTFTISGSELAITSAGVLTFASAPDYETKSSYSATVTASDGTNSTTQDITVNVTNVNDNSPSFTSSTTFSAAENQTAIDTVTATDADGDTITYSISGSDITINSSTGVIAFVSAPDYETKSSYSATVTASDGTNSTTQDITVNIQNIPSVSGVAYASRYSVMDSDIPNTDYLTDSNNDFIDTAQPLINPSIVTGHVGGDDGIDIFSVSTSSSMYVNLDVIDYVDDAKELRVYIYNSDGSARETSYTSASIEQNMTVLLPSSGNYLIAVDDLYGSSNYILTLGQRYSTSAYETSTDFIPDYISNEFIGYTPESTRAIENKNDISENRIKIIESERSELFDLTGEIFDQPGVKKFNMKSMKGFQPSPYNEMNATNRFGSGFYGLAPLTQKQKDYLNHWSYLQKLRKLSSETIFDFNYEFEITAFTRDPEYNKQWNLERVQLEPVLNSLGQDVKDIAVAVIDSGGPTPGSTAWNESNLIDGGYDFVYGNSNSIDYLATSSYTGQDISHGTHVSTTIAAKNNGTGINGYAVKALNINVFPVTGTGSEAKTGGASQDTIIQAIRYAAGLSNSSGSVAPTSTPIKVINMSLGAINILYPTAYCAAVQDAIDQGITVVVAAGNAQDTYPGLRSYPASCVGAISVGATNSGGDISYYSQQNAAVDISAPGGGKTDLDGDGLYDWILAYGNDSQLRNSQGTSMASPQVAAAIALMYSVDSTLTPARVDSMLANGELTDDRGVAGDDDAFGWGELNLVKAIRNIQEDAGVSASFGYTSTSFLEFGSETTQLTVDLVKVGSSSLSFSNLTSPNATGLTYNQTSVDAEGFGTYTLFIDRSSIPNGEYSTTINFNLSDGSKVAVRVYYNVGALRSRPNIGKTYIGMYHASDDSLWGYGELEVDGSVSFIANDVAPGDYYILTSTDINDNNIFCEYGELCEYYPRLSDISTYFTVSDSNLSGYEIYLNPLYKYGGPNAASLSSNSQLSNINNNFAKENNIKGLEKISINSISLPLSSNPIKKGDNSVIPE